MHCVKKYAVSIFKQLCWDKIRVSSIINSTS